MFKFKLNDQLKKYIREVSILPSDDETIKRYARECKYRHDISINIDNHDLHFSYVEPVFDKEKQLIHISRTGHSSDVNFDIHFDWVLKGNVQFITSDYGHIDTTERFIELISSFIDNGNVEGCRYEFIKERFESSYDKIFKINGIFYEVYYSSPGMREPEAQLCLTEAQTGQYQYVTATELLRGNYSYMSDLLRDEDGSYIPHLKIKEYKLVKD